MSQFLIEVDDNEYINRKTLQNNLSKKKSGPANKRYTEGWNDAILCIKSMISSAKASDVAPVRHGWWIYNEDGFFACSECGNPESSESNFCRYCGARMDGDEKC